MNLSVMLSFIYCMFCCFFVLPNFVIAKGQLRNLNDETWIEMLSGEWMVEFYAPWCPACQQLQPVWKDYAQWSDDLSIKVGSVDVTASPGLSGRFMIITLPTIFHVKDGVFRLYRGSRDKDSFISFVEEKKWQSIDPIPAWKSPGSYSMSAVSYFFKLSMLLRNIHNSLVEDYHIPYWCSYILFGVLTILVGIIFGLIVVCVIDCLCPSKFAGYQPISSSSPAQSPKKFEDEFQGEDVIREDSEDKEENEIRKRNVDSK